MARKAQVKIVVQVGSERFTWWDEEDMTAALLSEDSSKREAAHSKLRLAIRRACSYRDSK